ncbi:MAG: isochorismatase family protein [Alphaproteobacteria bacterium]|nr:isochorismatase family protein [Alphaproteobacteria bacterium]
MLMNRDRAALCVIDIQDRLLPVIQDGQLILDRTLTLINVARRLAIPVLCSEQYPKGLGPSVASLRKALDESEIFPKTHFSCADEPMIAEALSRSQRKQIVLCGVEAHVCVLQSAMGFQAAGYDVFVVGDVISSRASASVDAAKARLVQAGISVVTLEMVVFEWLGQSGTPEFKDLRGLIT